jgi:hypothetical protein
MFRKAEKRQAKLRMALIGPSGSGKTYSSLRIAQGLGGHIAMLDTEQGSGELYADLTDYDVARLTPPFTPDKYIQGIKAAEQAGYNVLIIDSLSHAWAGQGGLLEEVDKRKASQKNQFTAWRDVTPMHNALVDAILQSTCHIIVTMRTKTAYDFQKDDKGQLKPVKIGLAPVQRDGMEYEFTVVMDLENEKHMASSTKDRTSLFDGQYFVPSQETGQALRQWLETGSAPAPEPEPVQPPQFAAPTADNSGQGQPQGQPQTPAHGTQQAQPQAQNGTQPPRASEPQVKKLHVLCGKLGLINRDSRLEKVNIWLGQKGKSPITSINDLEKRDASELIELLERHVNQQARMTAKQQQAAQHVENATELMDEAPF